MQKTWSWIKDNAAAIMAVAAILGGFAGIIQIGVINPMHQRFDAIDQRFDATDQRINDLRAEMNGRFDAQDKYMNARFDAVDQRFDAQSINVSTGSINASTEWANVSTPRTDACSALKIPFRISTRSATASPVTKR